MRCLCGAVSLSVREDKHATGGIIFWHQVPLITYYSRRIRAKAVSMNEQVLMRKTLERFRQWAETTHSTTRYGEWECEYEGWGDIYESVRAVLRIPVERWDDDTKQLLIYAIARDNETELISEELTDEQLLVLAATALNSDEWEAKWQLAEKLGKCSVVGEREKFLLA